MRFSLWKMQVHRAMVPFHLHVFCDTHNRMWEMFEQLRACCLEAPRCWPRCESLKCLHCWMGDQDRCHSGDRCVSFLPREVAPLDPGGLWCRHCVRTTRRISLSSCIQVLDSIFFFFFLMEYHNPSVEKLHLCKWVHCHFSKLFCFGMSSSVLRFFSLFGIKDGMSTL